MFWPWHMWLRWSMWRFLETWRTLQLLDCVWGDSVDVRKAKIMVLDLLDEAGKWIGHSGMVFCLVHMFNHNYLVWWSRLANIRPRLNPQHKSGINAPINVFSSLYHSKQSFRNTCCHGCVALEENLDGRTLTRGLYSPTPSKDVDVPRPEASFCSEQRFVGALLCIMCPPKSSKIN